MSRAEIIMMHVGVIAVLVFLALLSSGAHS